MKEFLAGRELYFAFKDNKYNTCNIKTWCHTEILQRPYLVCRYNCEYIITEDPIFESGICVLFKKVLKSHEGDEYFRCQECIDKEREVCSLP